MDWPPPSRPQRRRGRRIVFGLIAALLFGGGTALSYYVESLWFGALGFSDVFWKTLNFQAAVFVVFAVLTFAVLYGSFLALKPARLADITSGPILINGQPISLPVEPVLRLIALLIAVVISGLTGLGMMAQWTTLGLYWHGSAAVAAGGTVDPIFGRPLGFYLFTYPAWQLVAGWFTTLAVITCVIAGFFAVITNGTRAITRKPAGYGSLRGVSFAFAVLLLAIAAQVYLGRFARILADHQIFAGVTYTDANITLTGLLYVVGALVLGALICLVNGVRAPRLALIVGSVAPALVAYVVLTVIGWYVTSFIVKPNELVRERPYIANNIEFTRRAFALDRVERVSFPAETGLEAMDADNNRQTLENIRLWDWRPLQDTLRQIQAIRTYYDFADIDIDRYQVDGETRQMLVAARELNIERLPASSRNWINEKLIYTHGYGVTMTPVNGFTPDGGPELLLGNMPVESKVPSLKITRPQIYFGELTNTDVYVRTGQQEFDYPEGDTNSLTSYEGDGGIRIGGFTRRMLIALDRGDITKLPFSDDVNADSRLLMRRNIRDRVETLAPFLLFDDDPYIVITNDGRLTWMMDAYTASASYPYSRHFVVGRDRVNYLRNSVKAAVDAYDGTVVFYVYDEDPIIAAYRAMFPSLFRDKTAMPADLQQHVRYPELMLQLQATVYGLYHMTTPDVFYNREDLWSIASVAGLDADRQQGAQTMEPNFVLMKLPGEEALEFIEILPFTPANRNNLIGWIAGRSDEPNYGTSIVYNFPENRLVDGPLQIDARIEQNAQLSGQLSLWNRQGSQVRRGSVIVLPIGKALLYAEPIYLQAQRSPMPELRMVVLALQDRLTYAPTFEGALAALFGTAPSTLSAQPTELRPPPGESQPGAPVAPSGNGSDPYSLISEAARDLEEYQRLTAEGRLGEAGQRLEGLKQKLDQLNRRPQ
ncbi:MAG: UPF0182 family protein [Luteitalea sp.]|nr:UPF0182 family protein [Luteitalea sp.]